MTNDSLLMDVALHGIAAREVGEDGVIRRMVQNCTGYEAGCNCNECKVIWYDQLYRLRHG
jgi:hypothetical protein